MVVVKKRRECPVCKKVFKPMTDAQWKVVKYIHDTTSERHRIDRLVKQAMGR